MAHSRKERTKINKIIATDKIIARNIMQAQYKINVRHKSQRTRLLLVTKLLQKLVHSKVQNFLLRIEYISHITLLAGKSALLLQTKLLLYRHNINRHNSQQTKLLLVTKFLQKLSKLLLRTKCIAHDTLSRKCALNKIIARNIIQAQLKRNTSLRKDTEQNYCSTI